VNSLVKEVITNTTSFERVASDSAVDLCDAGSPAAQPFLGKAAAAADGKHSQSVRPAAHRLLVHPRFPYESGETHGCNLCPANLCKVG
jgi:hypothetical protein